MRLFQHLFSMAAVALLAGCSAVEVQKIPSQADYQQWGDRRQAEVDSIKGIRYYMPRPYVAVHQSFPVRTDIYFARGLVSPDGTSVFITEIAGADEQLKKQLGVAPIKINSRLITTRPADPDTPFVPQGEEDEKPPVPAPTTAPAKDEPPATKPSETPQPAPQPQQQQEPPPGIFEQRVTNDNGAFAFQPLRGSLDIVYLPDFEEQYAVSIRQGLGDAKFEMAMGQAWSLQGLNSKVDNTQVNGLIMGLLSKAADLATQGMAGLFSKLVPPLAPGETGAFTAQGAEKTDAPGVQVSLRIVVVHYAAQGLYPILKGKEIASLDRLVNTQPSQVQNWATATPGTFTLPLYPYQRISFNTFRYIGVEVIRPSSPAFETLYPATGTDALPINTSLKEIADAMRALYGTGSAGARGGGGGSSGDMLSRADPNREELLKRISDMTVPAGVTGAAVCYSVGPNTEFSATKKTILVDLKKNPDATGDCGTPAQALEDLQTQAEQAAKQIQYDKPFKLMLRTAATTTPADDAVDQ